MATTSNVRKRPGADGAPTVEADIISGGLDA
jgi:hypothetical protein